MTPLVETVVFHYIFGFSIQEWSAIIMAISIISGGVIHLVHNSITKPLNHLSKQMAKFHIAIIKISEKAAKGDSKVRTEMNRANVKISHRLTKVEDTVRDHDERLTDIELRHKKNK